MKKASIKMSILIPSLAVLVAGIMAVVAVVGVLSSNSTKRLTDRLMDASVNRYSSEFRAYSEDVYGSIEAITPLISNLADSKSTADESDPREAVIDILTGALSANDKVVSVWTCWEPNAFDGKDREYAGSKYHDSTGRFIPYIYRDGNKVAVDALAGYDDPVDGEYYQGARSTGRPYVTDPYIYDFGGQEISIYTLAIPILKNGAVVGVVGADINLQDVIKVMNAGEILDDGYLMTISPGGFITTHPNANLLLKHYDTTWIANYRADFESILVNGGSFAVVAYSDQLNTNISFLGSGVTIGDSDRHWIVCGIVPETTVNADANSLLWTIIAIGLALIVLVGVTIFMIVRNRLKDMPALTATAEAMALGDIDSVIPDTGEEATKNEISLLTRAFAKMTAGIRQQADLMSRIANGDYSVAVPVRSDKDVINQAINHMLDSTNSTLHQISGASDQVSTGSRQIADGAQMLAQGATEQAGTIEKLSSTIGEIATKTGQNAEMAKEAADLSNVIKRNAEKGSLQMDQMMQAVKEINEASNQISKVIKVIDDIAFQTNILALNASVEAARAGQHGKGFAVVADEVRNLAAKSADAARDTSGLIENSMEKANMGYSIATDTVASLRDIVDGINRSAEIVAKIAHSSDEQASAITNINTAIDQVAQVVQQNSATAEQSAAASEEMSGQSNLLEDLISHFKLKDSQNKIAFESNSLGEKTAAPKSAAFESADNGIGYGKY